MFWIVQFLLIGFMLFLYFLDKFHQSRAGKGGWTATVMRGDKSMANYYALYASVNGLLVALALSVKTAEDYKVIISILDTACCFYIFVLNQFMRNKIVELTEYLTKVESR
jgi:hypothetical protein